MLWDSLYDKYASDGLKEIEETKILQLSEFQRFGSPMKIVKEFGGKAAHEKAVKDIIDEVDFTEYEERHAFGSIYESF